MPYNPETGRWEYGSQWDGVDNTPKAGNPFVSFPGSKRQWNRYSRLMNDDNPNNDPQHDRYGNPIGYSGQTNRQQEQAEAQAEAEAEAQSDAAASVRRNKDQGVYAFYEEQFQRWGLSGDLADKVMDWSKDLRGSSNRDEQLLLQIRDSPEYKERFAGNIARAKNGLPMLAESDYLQLESSYKGSMQMAGLPKGFHDDPTDFSKFIANDVSPDEVKRRATLAGDLAINKNPALWAELKTRGITKGDAAAILLDPKQGLPAVERKLAGAGVGATAREQGLKTGNKFENRLVDKLGLAGDDPLNAGAAVRQGMANVAETKDRWNALATRGGGTEAFSDKQLVKGEFDLSPKVAKKKRELASAERARFGGKVGSSTAFGTNRV